MDDNFSPRVREVITFSRDEALRLGHDYIGTEHIMLGILRKNNGEAVTILNNLDVDLDFLRNRFEALIPENPNKMLDTQKKNVHLTKQAEHALKRAFLEKKIYKTEVINTGHILLSILRNTDDPTTILLNRMNVDYDNSKDEFMQLIAQEKGSDMLNFETKNQAFESEDNDNLADKPGSLGSSQKKTTRTPVLYNFGRDLTEMATEGNLDPVVGREKEIERVSQILSRRKKNNPMLIGEPGVGKSA